MWALDPSSDKVLPSNAEAIATSIQSMEAEKIELCPADFFPRYAAISEPHLNQRKEKVTPIFLEFAIFVSGVHPLFGSTSIFKHET